MLVLKFDKEQYQEVKEGVRGIIIHTGNLLTVLIDFEMIPGMSLNRLTHILKNKQLMLQ